MAKPLVIALIGSPGSGKGTQGILLAEKLEAYYFETSKLIEKAVMEAGPDEFVEIEGKKYYLQTEKDLWKRGVLCSPPYVSNLVNQKIKELAKEQKGIVLSGSPRTLYEAENIMPLIEESYGKENIKVVEISISPEESAFRNSHRRICELMRHPILWNKETENLQNCPLDGSKLLRREGLDDPETIKVRLVEYKKRTLPLFDFFKKRGIEVNKINGEQSPEEVYQDISKVIK
ncbi:nucleoside monophosphate kinase [Candidatus Parcubacteria bacterium]|nr:nucleoside monophosphate kinase [Candidatus Parcubacteria bacterium]